VDASKTISITAIADAKVAVPQHVVHRAFPTETVLLNLETGKYHGLNPTAGRMFEVLEETGSPREAATRIADEFELPIDAAQADLNELCAGLVARGLLRVVSPEA
jgi:coenzyme PQQ synthesis protein D (PqqD)